MRHQKRRKGRLRQSLPLPLGLALCHEGGPLSQKQRTVKNKVGKKGKKNKEIKENFKKKKKRKKETQPIERIWLSLEALVQSRFEIITKQP